jgi:hypothetical protein
MGLFIPLLVGTACILALEWTMWRLFRRRLEGLHFPREVDVSSARFFNVHRIFLVSLAHTLLLCLALLLTLLLLW